MISLISNVFSTNLTPIFYQILYMTVIGSTVGIIIYFIRNLFEHKLSAKWKCIMWLIVIMALLVPIRFELKLDKQIIKNEIINTHLEEFIM